MKSKSEQRKTAFYTSEEGNVKYHSGVKCEPQSSERCRSHIPEGPGPMMRNIDLSLGIGNLEENGYREGMG